jgi:hypothetical protein
MIDQVDGHFQHESHVKPPKSLGSKPASRSVTLVHAGINNPGVTLTTENTEFFSVPSVRSVVCNRRQTSAALY